MSYQVLARKWRPRTFHELVGQEHVQRALVNALDQGRLHHAYLFTGTRGVGKTTLARILAKCLNCTAQGVGDEGITSTPCGQCDSCRAIDEGRFVDLIEVDAASRTKVEDTRELLDNVQYAPTQGRYKVYLIDEVHMLSTHSFNALLKTLEEPPPHVKFLLATTDPQKLPVTVLSRCLQFTLKNMAPERIVEHLTRVLEAESVPCDESALWLLGKAADGSMRDAMSLTDQAIAFGQGQVRHADVAAMLGTLDHRHVLALLEALAEVDAARVLAEVAALAEQGPDFAAVLDDVTGVRGFGTESTFAPRHRERADSLVLDRYSSSFLGASTRNYLSRGLDHESRSRFAASLGALRELRALMHELPGDPRHLLLVHWGPLSPAFHRNLGQELEPDSVAYVPVEFSTDKSVWLTPNDPHWNEQGHARVAELLYGLIRTKDERAVRGVIVARQRPGGLREADRVVVSKLNAISEAAVEGEMDPVILPPPFVESIVCHRTEAVIGPYEIRVRRRDYSHVDANRPAAADRHARRPRRK